MFRFLSHFVQRLAAAGTPRLGEDMNQLETPEALEDCLRQSEAQPVLLLKHSTRCPISAGALREVEAYQSEAGEGTVPVYVNLVVESRDISDEIASQLGVQHASPQAFLIHNRKVRWQTSHHAIQASAIRRAVAENAAG